MSTTQELYVATTLMPDKKHIMLESNVDMTAGLLLVDLDNLTTTKTVEVLDQFTIAVEVASGVNVNSLRQELESLAKASLRV